MARDSRKAVEEEEFDWGPDTIEAEIRERVRGDDRGHRGGGTGGDTGGGPFAAGGCGTQRIPPRRA